MPCNASASRTIIALVSLLITILPEAVRSAISRLVVVPSITIEPEVVVSTCRIAEVVPPITIEPVVVVYVVRRLVVVPPMTIEPVPMTLTVRWIAAMPPMTIEPEAVRLASSFLEVVPPITIEPEELPCGISVGLIEPIVPFVPPSVKITRLLFSCSNDTSSTSLPDSALQVVPSVEKLAYMLLPEFRIFINPDVAYGPAKVPPSATLVLPLPLKFVRDNR